MSEPTDAAALADRLLDHVRALGPGEGGLRAGEGLVIGLSGGGDSMALLDLLHRLAPERGLRLVAAHLHHGLRPEADDERAFCRRACEQRDIPFVTLSADVGRRALRKGAGLEAAGRRARHALYEFTRRRHGLDRIATGHHLDDHVETLALSVLRGTGLRGLTGIAPEREAFVRPLRALSRDTLRAYLVARGLGWCEDASNQDPSRRRNWLRAEGLRRIDAAFEDLFGLVDWRARLHDLSRRATQERAALEELVQARLQELVRESGLSRLVLDRVGFEEQTEPVRFQLLRAAVERVQSPGAHQRWNEAAYSDVLSFVTRARNGTRWPLPGGGWAQIERDVLILTALADEYEGSAGTEGDTVTLPALHTELLPAPAVGCSLGEPSVAWFDAARVRPPFTLRVVRPGDRLQPFGMEGHKKVATLLAERSVPRDRRPHQLVVCDADGIVWVVGITTSERARVDTTTRAVWRLSIVKGPRP